MSYAKTITRLDQLGISQPLCSQIHREISKWVNSSGPEWTVSRLKDLKLYYIKFRLHQQKCNPPSWIGLKSDGYPKGPFGQLFRAKPSRRVFYALQAYTSFISDKITVKQQSKFLNSVVIAPPEIPHIYHLREAVEEVLPLLKERVVKSYKDYPFSSSRFAPDSSCKSMVESPECLFEDTKTKVFWDFYSDPRFEGIFADALDDLSLRISSESVETDLVGKISVIQEPGFKARWIANPRRIFQIALLPMGNQLFNLIKQLPWDCTFDQLKGVRLAQKALQRGSVVHSVDLSDATNHFPLDLQIRVLKWMPLIDSGDRDLFATISRKPWKLPHGIALQTNTLSADVTWSTGQPLGLYPSFALFALVHGLIVRACEIKHSVKDTFAVLGDDIIIWNDDVYQDYVNYLNLLHVPISEQKTICSNRIAEFAGTLIGPNYHYVGTKWRPITQENILDVVSHFPRTLRMDDKVEYLAQLKRLLPYPLGLGENPDGYSLRTKAILLLPVFMQMNQDNSQSYVRHTHDQYFRETKAYAEVFNDNIDSREEFENLISKCVPFDYDKFSEYLHASAIFKGVHIQQRLMELFQFSSVELPDSIANMIFKWDERSKFINAFRSRRSTSVVQYVRSFFNQFQRKVVNGQISVVGLKRKTFEDAVNLTMIDIALRGWDQSHDFESMSAEQIFRSIQERRDT